MITVTCAYKTGGDFTLRYVINLYHAVKKNVSGERVMFVCYTDCSAESMEFEDLIFIPIRDDLHGWWSKLSCFIIPSATIYFDLDTVIVKDFSLLIAEVKSLTNNDFLMLRPQKQTEDWASGIMAWNGDMDFLYRNYTKKKAEKFHWDQRYISDELLSAGKKITAIQDVFPGIYSYKHHCQEGLPEDTSIVLFHGHPRPHEVENLPWIRRHWLHENA